MVLAATQVKWRELQSELEALLTEAELIRLYQPPVNVLLKDDKSPIYVLITQEEFPRVLTIRKRELTRQQQKGTVLGPFQSAYKLQEVLKLVRPIFPWCNQRRLSVHSPQIRACFYSHLGLCPGVCTRSVDSTTYAQSMHRLAEFLRGKASAVRTELESELKHYSLDQAYEQAAVARDQLQMIREVTSKEYRLAPEAIEDTHILDASGARALIKLKQLLSDYQSLPIQTPLSRIEAYDVSNLSGQHSVVSLVCSVGGELSKDQYRLFNIATLQTPNDYAMLQEAIARRQHHPEWGRPDVIMIDGGKGQVRAVLKTWRWRIPVFGLAKDPDRLVIPNIDWASWQEGEPPNTTQLQWRILRINQPTELATHLQKLRDEAHRFANVQRKRLLKKYILTV